MGFGLPASIGAWFACPDQEIWLIDGDGSFQMTQSELSTAVQEGANVKVAILNNGFLGMVRQWQEFFMNKRYAATPITGPDFVKLADAHGIPGKRITEPGDVTSAIQFARKTPGPVVLDFRVEKEQPRRGNNDRHDHRRNQDRHDRAPVWHVGFGQAQRRNRA